MIQQYKFSSITEYFLYLLLLLSSLFSINTWADNKILRVGLAPGAPFVIAKHNHYEGISVSIWETIAKNLNLNYQYIPLSEHINDDVKLLAKGQIDILIGPIIPTETRVRQVDFTNPYYLNQIKIIIPVKKVTFLQVLKTIFNSAFSSIALFIIGFFIIYIHVFWFFEGRKGYMDVKPTYFSGILTAFWIHTLGISFRKPPTHAYTRSFRLVWAIVTVLLLSTVTATMTSSLTIALSSNFKHGDTIEEFKYDPVAAVSDTALFDIAKEEELSVKSVKERKEAIDLLLNGKVAGFVDYGPVADYYIREHDLTSKLTMSNLTIQQNTFAIALPINSPLRHKINMQLATLQSIGEVHFICKKFLSEKTAQNCDI